MKVRADCAFPSTGASFSRAAKFFGHRVAGDAVQLALSDDTGLRVGCGIDSAGMRDLVKVLDTGPAHRAVHLVHFYTRMMTCRQGFSRTEASPRFGARHPEGTSAVLRDAGRTAAV
jgi:hypothetical protein